MSYDSDCVSMQEKLWEKSVLALVCQLLLIIRDGH